VSQGCAGRAGARPPLARVSRVLRHPVTGAVCRLLLGGIFIYTGLPKLLHPAEFARLAAGYRILHPELVNLFGITMPWVEVVGGACLVIGVLPRSSALVIAGLLAAFIGAAFLALARGLEISCGCFFPLLGESRLTWKLAIRDAIMLAIALQPLIWPSGFIPGRRR